MRLRSLFLALALILGVSSTVAQNASLVVKSDTVKLIPNNKFGFGGKFFTFPDGSTFTTAAKITLDSMAYGGAYIADDHPDTLVFTVAGEFQTIGSRHATDPRGYPLTSGGVLKNVTVQDSSLTLGVDGTCNMSWSISLESVTGVATNAKFNAYLYVNDVKQEKSGSMRAMSGSSDCGQLVGTPMTYSLKKGDIIKLKLGNFDDANGNTVRALYAKLHLTNQID